MEISQYNDMGRVWDTCKYHPKLSVSIFKAKVTQDQVKERSNSKFLGFGGVIHVFGSVFRQKRETWL